MVLFSTDLFITSVAWPPSSWVTNCFCSTVRRARFDVQDVLVWRTVACKGGIELEVGEKDECEKEEEGKRVRKLVM